jgi:hypothetical protein
MTNSQEEKDKNKDRPILVAIIGGCFVVLAAVVGAFISTRGGNTISSSPPAGTSAVSASSESSPDNSSSYSSPAPSVSLTGSPSAPSTAIPSAAPAGTQLTNFTVKLQSGCEISLTTSAKNPTPSCPSYLSSPTEGLGTPDFGYVSYSARPPSGGDLLTFGYSFKFDAGTYITGPATSASYSNCVNATSQISYSSQQTIVEIEAKREIFCVETAQTIVALTIEEYDFSAIGQNPFVVLNAEIWKYIPPALAE